MAKKKPQEEIHLSSPPDIFFQRDFLNHKYSIAHVFLPFLKNPRQNAAVGWPQSRDCGQCHWVVSGLFCGTTAV